MPITIDADDLIMAMTSNPELTWGLDPTTGEIGLPEEEGAELPEHWISIPTIDSRDDYRLMEYFASSQPDPEVREALERALRGKGAFRRFRDAAGRWPDILAAWREYHDREVLALGERWLEDEELDATIALPPPRVVAPPPQPAGKPKPPRVGLMELLLLGAPDGKTELIDGKVPRVFVARDPSSARKVFADVARDIHELCGLGWRKGYIEGRDAVTVDRYTLRIDGRVVELAMALEPGLWARFGER